MTLTGIFAVAFFATQLIVIPISGFRVLSLMTVNTKSHHIWMAPLTDELARRGHEVYAIDIMAHPEAAKLPSLTVKVIDMEPVFTSEQMEKIQKGSLASQLSTFMDVPIKMCKDFLTASEVKKLIHPNFTKKFDVIIMDFSGPCLLGLSHLFNAPIVAVTPFPASYVMDKLVGGTYYPSFVPYFFSKFESPMNLWQRTVTTLLYLGGDAAAHFFNKPKIQPIINDFYGSDLPSMDELLEKVVMALVNEIPGIERPRPMAPSMIPVGGMHLKPAKTLPQDLAKWLEASKEGFIFVSFGSVVKSESVDPDKRRAMIETFAALKERVLWKFDDGNIEEELPKNVRVAKWLPQNDILGHPSIRLFVSHCGGLSSQEVAYHGVPVLCVPFFGDQFLNADKLIRLGMARKLLMSDLTKDTLIHEIREMIDSSTYKGNATYLSNMILDQKETPLERAVWWTEYIARNKGAPHLRSAARDLNSLQLLLFDVWALLTVTFLVTLIISIKLCRFICRRIFGLCCSSGSKKSHKD